MEDGAEARAGMCKTAADVEVMQQWRPQYKVKDDPYLLSWDCRTFLQCYRSWFELVSKFIEHHFLSVSPVVFS